MTLRLTPINALIGEEIQCYWGYRELLGAKKHLAIILRVKWAEKFCCNILVKGARGPVTK